MATLQDYLAPGRVNNLPYSDFKTLLQAGKMADVALGESVITGTLINEDIPKLVSTQTAERLSKLAKGNHPFTVVRVNDPGLVQDLESAKVTFEGQLQNKWLPTLLSWILPALIFFAIWSFLAKRMASTGPGRHGRVHVDWQEQSQGIHGDGHQGHV